MPIVKTLGWVIRRTPIRESSLIITVFTKKLGRVDAIARAVRRPSSRLRAGLELFTLSEFVLFIREGKELYNVSEVSPLGQWEEFRTNRLRFEIVSLFAITLHRILPEEVSFPQLFEDVKTMLPFLASLEPKRLKNLYVSFLLKLTKMIGIDFVVERCVKCGEEEDLYSLSFKEGGALCRACSQTLLSYPLSPDMRKILITLKRWPISEVLKLNTRTLNPLEVVQNFIETQTGVAVPRWPESGGSG